jgi:hypothetical protein
VLRGDKNGGLPDLRLVSSLPLEGPLNDHAFKLSLLLSDHRGEKKDMKVLEPATWIEPATCGLRMETLSCGNRALSH